MDKSTLDKPIKITEQFWPKNICPLVSVFSWVYNHKEFIVESIESILIQETTFPIEIIIHDDASTDGTAEIIRSYEKKYPNILFKNILHQENQWSQGKSVMNPLFEKPQGKYIALTHGDDYWTDPLKLQKQVDFLEANEEYSMSFHDAIYLDMQTGKKSEFVSKFNSERECKTKDIILADGEIYPTASLVFRTDMLDLPKWSKHSSGDYTLFLLLSVKGKIHNFNEFMSTYRTNVPGSLTSIWKQATNKRKLKIAFKTIKRKRQNQKMLLSFNKYTHNRYLFYVAIKVLHEEYLVLRHLAVTFVIETLRKLRILT